MLKFEWNGLRLGDQVLVHDDSDAASPLDGGVVVMVQTAPTTNDIAIRVRRSGVDHVVRPRRLAVHLVPLDHSENCWRCAPRVTSPSGAMSAAAKPAEEMSSMTGVG